MDVHPETKLHKPSAFSYRSFGSSPQLIDGSLPCDWAKKQGEGIQVEECEQP